MLTSLHPKTSIAAGLCASRLCASRHLMTGQSSPSGRRAQIPLSCPLASALGSILTFGFLLSPLLKETLIPCLLNYHL